MDKMLDHFEQSLIAPHSQETEEALLGSVLINPDAFHEITLQPDDFFLLRNGYIWEAMQRLVSRKQPPEYLLVLEELRAQGRLDDIGGAAYVSLLMVNVGTSVYASEYAQVVKRAAVRRELLSVIAQMTVLTRNDEMDIHEVLDRSRQLLDSVVVSNHDQEDALVDIVDASEQHLLNEQEPSGAIQWFLVDLHHRVGSLMPGNLVVPAARMKVGKTRFKLCQALHSLRQGKRVLIMTTEMSVEEMFWTMIELQSKEGITTVGIRERRIKGHDAMWLEYLTLAEEIRQWAQRGVLHIVAAHSFTAEKVYGRLMQDKSWDLVIVDYIQRLVPSPGYEPHSWQDYAQRMTMLKAAAQRSECVIFASSQLNREGMRNASAVNAAGSDNIGRECDYFLVIEREESGYGSADSVTVQLTESRFTPTTPKIPVYIDPRTGAFKNAAGGQ